MLGVVQSYHRRRLRNLTRRIQLVEFPGSRLRSLLEDTVQLYVNCSIHFCEFVAVRACNPLLLVVVELDRNSKLPTKASHAMAFRLNFSKNFCYEIYGWRKQADLLCFSQLMTNDDIALVILELLSIALSDCDCEVYDDHRHVVGNVFRDDLFSILRKRAWASFFRNLWSDELERMLDSDDLSCQASVIVCVWNLLNIARQAFWFRRVNPVAQSDATSRHVNPVAQSNAASRDVDFDLFFQYHEASLCFYPYLLSVR